VRIELMSRASRRRRWHRWLSNPAASKARDLALALFALLVISVAIASVIAG
jgi:hypothetical protein